jgi:cytoskeletal protein RodZ
MSSKKPVVRSKKSKRFANAIGAGVIGLAAVCVVATAVVIATREPSPPEDTTAADTLQQEAEATKPSPKKGAAPQAQTKKTAADKPLASSAAPARTLTTNMTTAKAPAVESKAKASEANAPVVEPAGVTITGCLERDNDTFRLRDATGADAPKGRSWKSGFLKKGSGSIEIVDAANRLKLANHIGRRVSVTGSLLNREMQARSLQRVGTSCDQSPA